MKRIRQLRAVSFGSTELEGRVIEVPVEATVTGAEDVPALTELYGWRPVRG